MKRNNLKNISYLSWAVSVYISDCFLYTCIYLFLILAELYLSLYPTTSNIVIWSFATFHVVLKRYWRGLWRALPSNFSWRNLMLQFCFQLLPQTILATTISNDSPSTETSCNNHPGMKQFGMNQQSYYHQCNFAPHFSYSVEN